VFASSSILAKCKTAPAVVLVLAMLRLIVNHCDG
jgi:hypothetical protein